MVFRASPWQQHQDQSESESPFPSTLEEAGAPSARLLWAEAGGSGGREREAETPPPPTSSPGCECCALTAPSTPGAGDNALD